MIFNSYNFIIFFPIVTLIYYLFPHKIKKIWLLIASYYFYMCWNPKYVLILLFSTIITYICGLLIAKSDNINDKKKRAKEKKIIVTLGCILILNILLIFKYYKFITQNISIILNKLNFRLVNSPIDLLLPVGISFFTFQSIGYIIDVYRGEIKAEKNFFRYALFISFFPQLVAGPIERSKNLLQQINEKQSFDFERVKDGMLLMIWGFFQKIVIADRVSVVVDTVFNNFPKFKGLYIVIGAILFGIQIYCDFSGYSMIAIGASKILGFNIMENFNSPYLAMSISEFWKRWHISLTTWFRDYLYIPLGGNRKGKCRKYLNTMIVFLLSGLWHGANWTYVVWGGLNRSLLYSR